MKTPIFVIAACVAVATPAFAFAATGEDKGNRVQERFERVDRNDDGKITRDEAGLAASEMFKRLDTDGDGTVTMAEIGDGKRGKHGERRFERADADSDGKVTESEFEQVRLHWFERVDSNGDDAITLGEMESARHGKGKRKERSQD